MKINYSVSRKNASQNGSLDLPQYTNADWGKERVHNKIRRLIKSKHPRWTLVGYAVAHKPAKVSTTEAYEVFSEEWSGDALARAITDRTTQ